MLVCIATEQLLTLPNCLVGHQAELYRIVFSPSWTLYEIAFNLAKLSIWGLLPYLNYLLNFMTFNLSELSIRWLFTQLNSLLDDC